VSGPKSKSKAAKDRMVAQMTGVIERINQNLGKAIAAASAQGRKLRGHAVVAQRKLVELHATMDKLIPQIRHWLRSGLVASGKIINLHIPQVYSIVRGKVGKTVEFSLSWGITRLRGGFVLATMAGTKTEFVDASYALRAVEDLAALFGKDRLIRERAMVEGSIGTSKCPKYGFNRPAARSAAMMGVCGQRAVLGLNLTKLLRGVAGKKGIALAV